jgi:hypothetical protein
MLLPRARAQLRGGPDIVTLHRPAQGRTTPALSALEGAAIAFAIAGFAWLGVIYLRMLVSPAPQEMREGALIVTTLAGGDRRTVCEELSRARPGREPRQGLVAPPRRRPHLVLPRHRQRLPPAASGLPSHGADAPADAILAPRQTRDPHPSPGPHDRARPRTPAQPCREPRFSRRRPVRTPVNDPGQISNASGSRGWNCALPAGLGRTAKAPSGTRSTAATPRNAPCHRQEATSWRPAAAEMPDRD